MSTLRKNIFANFGGQAATTIIALVTVPLYIRFLGVEGYGLVSLLLAVQAITNVLDFGLSTTANREVSRYVAWDRSAAERRDLVRTLEGSYYVVGLMIFAALAAAAPAISSGWVRTEEFSAGTIRLVFLIAAASIGLRWPVALYHGMLRGTERQVALNLVSSLTTLMRGIGTILVLVLVARTVVAFYWWQLAFSGVELAAFAVTASRGSLGFAGRGGRFRWHILRDLWRFSARVGGMSVFALLLKQLDKVVISKLLPISQLGFYNAASLAAFGTSKIAQPVQSAVFPRLTQLHERRETDALSDTFHQACQLTAFLTVPATCVLLFFSHDVLWLWTHNAELARTAAAALSVLAAAMMLNSMMTIPLSLQLAAGETSLPLYTNGIGALLIAPLVWGFVARLGITGGALAWLIFNIAYFLLVPPIMFRRILPGHLRSWLFRDTVPFMAAGVASFAGARYFATDQSLALKVLLAAVAAATYAAVILSLYPRLRVGVLRLPRALRVRTDAG